MRCTCFSAAAWLRVNILEVVEAAAEAMRFLLPLGRASFAAATPGMSAMASLGRLSAACLSATMGWLLTLVMLAEIGATLLALLAGSQRISSLCCLSALELSKCASLDSTAAAGAATCSASGMCDALATGPLSGSAAVVMPPAAVVTVAGVATALADAAAATELFMGNTSVMVAIAADKVVVGMNMTSSVGAVKGGRAGKPQKGTATTRNCRG